MRRVLVDPPVARSASWCRRLAVLAIVLAIVAAAASKSGALRPETALGLLVTSFAAAVLALLMAVTASVVIWRTGRRGVAALLVGSVLAGGLLALPAWVAASAYDRPVINDISTDLVDPPLFSSSPKAIAARRGAMHELTSSATRQAQTKGYPDVQPVDIDLGPAETYAGALKLVKARRWTVIEAQPPAAPQQIGHIDAVARTLLMGFADDVTIRIAPSAPGRSRVDIRSASRVGLGDLGVNAARIEAFATELDDALNDD